MHKGFLKVAAIFGVLTVVLGAFAAHTIKPIISSEALAVFETGVRYQMYHAIALFITGILYKEFPAKSILLAGKLFIIGILVFSGSLYLLTYVKSIGASNFFWVGAITFWWCGFYCSMGIIG
jgi:uncharacterized membrane protein YgdD (TMEM256/DUF423 family)